GEDGLVWQKLHLPRRPFFIQSIIQLLGKTALPITRVRLSRLGWPPRGRLRFASRRPDPGRSTLYLRVMMIAAAVLLSARGIRTGALRRCRLRSLTIRLTDPKQEGGDPVRMPQFGKDGPPANPTLAECEHWRTANRFTFDS